VNAQRRLSHESTLRHLYVLPVSFEPKTTARASNCATTPAYASAHIRQYGRAYVPLCAVCNACQRDCCC
jgi:hypothetical protein